MPKPIAQTRVTTTSPQDARCAQISVALSIEDFNAQLKNSQNRNLRGSSLREACDILRNILDDAVGLPLKSDELVYSFNAVWDEIEVQDYPRPTVMYVPDIFFHLKAVRLCSPQSALTTSLANIMQKMWLLARNKLYVFAPLSKALRRAFLYAPEAVNLPFVEIIVNYANNPPSTKVEFELEDAMAIKLQKLVPKKSYASYYGNGEGYGHACIFDIVNTFQGVHQWPVVRQILDQILEPWTHQLRPIPMVSRWKTSTQLQVVLILSEYSLIMAPSPEQGTYLQTYLEILANEPLPRFRYLLEWIIARIYLRLPSRRKDILAILDESDVTNPKYVVSVMKMALMLAHAPDTGEDFALELMTQLVCLSASAKIMIRHEAQWNFPSLWDCAVERGWASLLDSPVFARLNGRIRGLESFQNPPAGRTREAFNIIADHNLSNLFQGQYLRIEPCEAERVTTEDFLAVWRDEATELNQQVAPKPDGLLTLGCAKQQSEREAAQPEPKSSDWPVAFTTLALQTKSSTWYDEISGTGTYDGNKSRRTRDVIVIASLIDNAYNIGGLSRIGEIFGVKSLQVRNLGVLESKDFNSVAVSSQLWLPILELGVEAVAQFLIQHKLQGYTVVGIEQTDNSKVLGQEGCQLPEKTVLVLGSEREGISSSLLADMDFCVEIKQRGLTRSMNVQTAAAVVLYEYSRQHP